MLITQPNHKWNQQLRAHNKKNSIMKKLLYLFISLTLFACSTDDDTNTLTISIDEVTPTTATIQWSVPTASDGQTIRYQIILNG